MICTYLRDSEKNCPLSDLELTVALREARETTGEDWQVLEHVSYRDRGWFRKPVEHRSFELYYDYLGNGIEYQLINFYRSNSSGSINTTVSADLIVAFLLGLVAGKKLYVDSEQSEGKHELE